jgi:hypothetical protein
MSPDTTLTATQEQVLALIAAGSTATAAAASAGIHRNTISNWLRGSPAFSQALACVHFDRALHWREQAESLAPGAVDTIRGIMADVSAPAAVRLKAALAILDKAAAPLPPPPSAPPSIDPESMHNPAQVPIPAAVRREPKPVPDPPQPIESVGPPAPPQPGSKVGRNAVCPCGSGKKFKRCCLSKPVDSPPA